MLGDFEQVLVRRRRSIRMGQCAGTLAGSTRPRGVQGHSSSCPSIRALILALESSVRVEMFALVGGGSWRPAFAAVAGRVLDGPIEEWLGS